MRSLSLLSFGLFFVTSAFAGPSAAATFSFETTGNGIDQQPTGTLSSGLFDLNLQAEPSAFGAVFREFNDGLGIQSRGVSGFFDQELDKFDTVVDSNRDKVDNESMSFSFSREGVLTGLNFDGVKDESLEYFILESASGVRINLFDSAANNFFDPDSNTFVVGAVDDAVTAGELTGEVVFLLEINSAIDDEAVGLRVPFQAGEEFTLTYGELGSAFGAIQDGNGARLQGITVVPEPSTVLLLGLVSAGLFAVSDVRRPG